MISLRMSAPRPSRRRSFRMHSSQSWAPSGRTASDTKVSGGHCEQFEQKCQISLELVFRYSERRSNEDQSCAACSIIRVEISRYNGSCYFNLKAHRSDAGEQVRFLRCLPTSYVFFALFLSGKGIPSMTVQVANDLHSG